MGACTITPDKYNAQVSGSQRKQTGSLHLSASYATGGDTWTANQFGLVTVDELVIESGGKTGTEASGYVFQPDTTNKKIKAYQSGAGADAALDEVQSGDLSATVVRYTVWGC